MLATICFLLAVAVAVMGSAYALTLRSLNLHLAKIAENAVLAEELRRHRIALNSALADDRLALLAWDRNQKFVIVEGGLYERSDMKAPKLGSDARATFAAWGPSVLENFERAVAGFADPHPYEISTPAELVAAGAPALTYRVRLRSNSQPGAGYAIAHDVTDQANALRLQRMETERAKERAEAEFARAAEYERLIQTKYLLSSPAKTERASF